MANKILSLLFIFYLFLIAVFFLKKDKIEQYCFQASAIAAPVERKASLPLFLVSQEQYTFRGASERDSDGDGISDMWDRFPDDRRRY